jgi:arylsulfatase A-like enzyme
VPILCGETTPMRATLHAEHAPCYDNDQAFHLLTDGRWKYIWRPARGTEQLFDLAADPHECTDLAADARCRSELERWRQAMIAQLKDRPEGFTDGRQLIAGRPYPDLMGSGEPPKFQ